MSKISDSLKAALAVYAGRPVASIKVSPDPKVNGTFAARASMVDGDTVDFLVVGSSLDRGVARSTPEEVAEAIEECQFEAWPPPAGKLRFF